jgi:competence protein ComEA
MILIFLIGFTTVVPYLYNWLFPDQYDVGLDRSAITRLKLQENEGRFYEEEVSPNEGNANSFSDASTDLFAFDPNTLSLEGWQRLGLSEKQAGAILKYRSKGGHFYKAEDLKKMYTLNERVYAKILPYVRIEKGTGLVENNKEERYPGTDHHSTNNSYSRPNSPANHFSGANRDKLQAIGASSKKSGSVMVELNSADTLMLDEVKGIGPAFARRIVKYRDRLGGFYKTEQLLEVFGLDSAMYLGLKNQVRVDLSALKKISINTAEFEDFKNHPYIRYKQVNALIQFRKQHGNYSNIADLKKVAIMTPEILTNLGPYLTF